MEIDMQQAEAPRRRRRPALSCLACRRKKVSCDRAQPCRRCISAGSPCIYRNEPGVPRPRKDPSTFQSIHHETVYRSSIEAAKSKASPSELPYPSEISGAVDGIESAAARSIEALEQGLINLNARFQELERSLQRPGPANDAHSSDHTYQRLSTTLNSTKHSRLTHWVAAPPEFSNMISYFKQTALFKQLGRDKDGASRTVSALSPLIDESVYLAERCKVLARSMKVGRPSRLESSSWSNITPPPREHADILVEAYFKYFESAYRILHLPTFATDYVEYWANPDAATVALRLEISLVAAIGSSVIDSPEKEAEIRNKAHEVVNAAHLWLSGPLEKHRLHLKAIQIHCLTVLTRQIFGIGGDLVWTSMGQLIHEAMQMGLHRDPSHLPGISLLHSELRRRLWATILEMSVQSSFDCEMPPRISLKDFDTEPPANINDNEVDQSTTELRSRPHDVNTMMSAQLLLLNSLPSRLQVVQLLNSIASPISYSECLDLSANISKACGSLSLLDQAGDEITTPFQRNFADYLTRRALLSLHGPFSCKAASNPLFAYSRKVCVETAMTIVSPEQDKVFARLMLTSGGIFKSGIRYAGVAVGVELIGQCQAQVADLTLARNAEYRNMLKDALKRLISLSEERIKHGESNVKNHTFLSLILTEADSIENGTPTELAIAQSARDSLAYCHELLLTQAGPTPASQLQDTEFSSLEGDFTDYDFDFDVDDFLQGSVFS